MQAYKKDFIELALACHALKFGEFILKSGRKSPYFFNAGMFYQNQALEKIGTYYAQMIIDHQLSIKHLFGPAYKGIPLATTTAIALSRKNYSVSVSFNRKEMKDHGEGGLLIGSPLNEGPTVMIDDVITAGTAFRESKKIIEANGGHLSAVLIALDRSEKGNEDHSTLEEIRSNGIEVHAIIEFNDLVQYLTEHHQQQEAEQLRRYHQQYGCPNSQK